jgi:hypothetical protein
MVQGRQEFGSLLAPSGAYYAERERGVEIVSPKVRTITIGAAILVAAVILAMWLR